MTREKRLRLVVLPRNDEWGDDLRAAVAEQEFGLEGWRTLRYVPISLNAELPEHAKAQPAEFGAVVGRFFEAALREITVGP